jgi:hypothetical protein
MFTLTTPTSFALVMTIALYGATQQDKQTKQNSTAEVTLPAYQMLSNPRLPAELREETGAWILEVETGGGLIGKRESYLLLTSKGSITLSDSHKDCLPSSSSFREVDSLVKQARPAEWTTPNADLHVSLCQECYKTTLKLFRREQSGAQSAYMAYWDTATMPVLSKEVATIYSAAERLKVECTSANDK